jgi:hypothetical protein
MFSHILSQFSEFAMGAFHPLNPELIINSEIWGTHSCSPRKEYVVNTPDRFANEQIAQDSSVAG